MRLVIAIISFVIAATLIGLGIGQKTVWAKPDNIEISTRIATSAPVTVIDGTALNANSRSQTISATGSNTTFAAYGRTGDVLAWVGEASYNLVTYDAETASLVSELVPGSETELPSATDSDLWFNEYSGESDLNITINVPEGISLVLMSDGIEPAPENISVRWPLDNSTPWVVPLVSAGGGLLILGLIMLLWAINHMRSDRGPRRKPPKMPKLPKPQKFQPSKPKPVAATSRSRRSIGSARIAIIPTVLIGALILVGCSANPTGGSALETTPTPTATNLDAAAQLEAPAVTESQAERIVSRISAVAAQADKGLDATLAGTRFTGPALALRSANYVMRAANSEVPALPTIPSGPVKIILPQQSDSWPRAVFAVVVNGDDDTVPPTALMLIQDDPRSQYKVHYATTLEPGTVIPKVAPATIGTNRFDPTLQLTVMPAGELAAAYGSILAQDTASEFYDLFEAEGDSLRSSIGLAFKTERAAGIPSTAQIAFSHAPGPGEIVALSTNDGGAIVATNLNEIETVTPVEAGAAINAPASFAALSGKTTSTVGLQATYGIQLLFYVPPIGSEGKIILLGYGQGLISASEIA
ncbi:MAG: hypothetical protein ACOH1J_04460 [Microbacteriaceae bacterium]